MSRKAQVRTQALKQAEKVRLRLKEIGKNDDKLKALSLEFNTSIKDLKEVWK